MDFDLILLGQSYRDEPVADLGPLVPLKLKDFTVLGVLDYSPIAREFLWTKCDDLDNHSWKGPDLIYLFACTDNFLEVILRGEALYGGERLPVVPLLDPDVD